MALGETEEFTKVNDNIQYCFVDGLQKYETSSKYVYKMSIDKFSQLTGHIPDYIKIDVDGPKLDIVKGMKKVLTNLKLKSVYVEINSKYIYSEIERIMESNGFKERTHKNKSGLQVEKNKIFSRM